MRAKKALDRPRIPSLGPDRAGAGDGAPICGQVAVHPRAEQARLRGMWRVRGR